MANTNTTPNMQLTVPSLTEPGPAYASEVSNDLVIIDGHDHDGVSGGVQINIAGQIIEDDLSLDGYNLTNTRSVEFISQPGTLTGSQDVNSIYVNQNNLGFNNINGIFVPITSGNTLAINALSLTNFSSRAVSSNFTILPTDTYNLININSTDGPITGTLPIAATISPVAANRLYIFRDVGELAVANNITIQVAVGSGNTFADSGATTFILASNGAYVAIYTDGGSQWFTWSQNTFYNETLNVSTGSQIILDSAEMILKGGSTIETHDASSEIIVANGSALLESGDFSLVSETTAISGGTVTWSSSAAETYDTGTTSTFNSGSTLTFNSGGTLTMNGTLQGTTTGGTLTVPSTIDMTGTLNLSGTTTQTGTIIMSSIHNDMTGNFNVQGGGVYLTVGGFITTDKASSISILGQTNLYGVNLNSVILDAGSYTIDSNSNNYDRYIGLKLASTGTWNISMPSSPTTGRLISIADINNIDPSTASYIVNLIGNGHTFAVPGNAGVSSSPSFPSSFSPWYQASGGAVFLSGWIETFIFMNNSWYPYSATT